MMASFVKVYCLDTFSYMCMDFMSLSLCIQYMYIHYMYMYIHYMYMYIHVHVHVYSLHVYVLLLYFSVLLFRLMYSYCQSQGVIFHGGQLSSEMIPALASYQATVSNLLSHTHQPHPPTR